jgi:HAE1 family hydrophobic/amphiphilic exporter-1/multidrug efflux pump
VFKFGVKKDMQCVWIDPVKLALWLHSCRSTSSFKSAKCRITFRKVNWKQYRAYRKTVGNLATAEEFNNVIIRTDGAKQSV